MVEANVENVVGTTKVAPPAEAHANTSPLPLPAVVEEDMNNDSEHQQRLLGEKVVTHSQAQPYGGEATTETSTRGATSPITHSPATTVTVTVEPAAEPVSSEKGSTVLAKYGRMIFGVLWYGSISIGIVLYNKWLLKKFAAPVFITWFQQVVTVILMLLGAAGGHYHAPLHKVFPTPKLKLMTALKLLPTAALFAGTLVLTAICLQSLDVVVYQVARSLTLVFVIIFSFILLKERQTWKTLASCGIMVVGFMMVAGTKWHSVGIGMLLGAFSSFAQAIYNVLIKYNLRFEPNKQLLLFYIISLTTILLPGAAIYWEGAIVKDYIAKPPIGGMTWPAMVGTGILSMLLNMGQYYLVSVTSPLTANIVGFAKSVLQALLSWMLFGEVMTLLKLGSLAVTILGSMCYTYAKYEQSHEEADKAKEAGATEEQKATAAVAAKKLMDTDNVSQHDIPIGMEPLLNQAGNDDSNENEGAPTTSATKEISV